MPREDREQNFEKALSRRLRSNCPDPETLAAYHERALPFSELNAWKAHVAGCADCQQVLAFLESTDSLEVGPERELDLVEQAAAPVGLTALGYESKELQFGGARRLDDLEAAEPPMLSKKMTKPRFVGGWYAY